MNCRFSVMKILFREMPLYSGRSFWFCNRMQDNRIIKQLSEEMVT